LIKRIIDRYVIAKRSFCKLLQKIGYFKKCYIFAVFNNKEEMKSSTKKNSADGLWM